MRGRSWPLWDIDWIFLSGNELVLEIKSAEGIAPVHRAQLLSYLKLSERRLGYVLNFNVVSLRDGIARVVNKL
jgi:GxxExxY protein